MVQYRAKILNVMLDCISLEVELDSSYSQQLAGFLWRPLTQPKCITLIKTNGKTWVFAAKADSVLIQLYFCLRPHKGLIKH